MPRPTKHDEARILAAAASLISSQGPAAATITAIGAAIGAPNGSIYHRFKSRDELLGRLWLDKAAWFQNRFSAALESEAKPRAAGLAAALSLPRAARDDFEGARIMLLYRREDFLGEGWSADMRAEAERLGQQQRDMLISITKRLFDRNTVAHRQLTAFAVLDVPLAAVRRYLAANERPPPFVDAIIEQAYGAVIAGAARTIKSE